MMMIVVVVVLDNKLSIDIDGYSQFVKINKKNTL